MSRRVVLGINLSHDESCAAVVDGRVVAAVENERLSRLKHNEGRCDFGRHAPLASILYCCREAGVEPREVELFVVNSVLRGARDALRGQLLGIPSERIADLGVPGHHLAHAYSAFHCSPFRRAAVLVLDTNGGYEYRPAARDRALPWRDAPLRQENYSVYLGEGSSLRTVHKDWLSPGEAGPGQLYMLYSAALQLTPRERGYFGRDCALAAGGKLMGYAAWDRGVTPAPALLPPTGPHLAARARDIVSRFRELGLVERLVDGAAALDGAWAHQLQRLAPLKRREGSLRERRWISLAGEAQRLLEDAVLRAAELARERTGAPALCLAGGTALNITACSKILERGLFRDVFIQPAAHDAGNAVGAALYGYHELLGGRRTPYKGRRFSAFTGRRYGRREVEEALWRARELGPFHAVPVDDTAQAESAARLLARGAVVAVCKGRSEFGPRALGHRSLLASAASRGVVARLNALKGREWYRPVAPVVLEEELPGWFDARFSAAPYMNLAARARERTRRLAPAVVHADGSSRVQTVGARDDRFLRLLLRRYARRTGVPILVNTSFNFGGEPIVETPLDALGAFLRAPGVQALLLDGWFVTRRKAPRAARRRRTARPS
jgi:carbamoyltransferase